jgi:hypothetical protein
MRRSCLAATFALLVGCSSQPDAEPFECTPPEGAQTFEAGTGEFCFQRVTPSERVDLMAGPQGGYHLWLAVGCADCGDSMKVRTQVFDATGAVLEGTHLREQFVELVGDAWPQHAGIQIAMPGGEWAGGDEPLQPPAPGTPLTIRVEALDASGGLLHAVDMPITVGDQEDWSGCGDCCEDCV